MSLTVRLMESADSEDLYVLRNVLAEDPALSGHVDVLTTPAKLGEMGWIADVLEVAVGSGGAVTVLLGSITTWLRSRGTDATIRVSASDGTTVEVAAQRLRPMSASEVSALVATWTRDLTVSLQVDDEPVG
jgi:hypothetical protein